MGFDQYQLISNRRRMIAKDGDYYTCEGETEGEKVIVVQEERKDVELVARGDIKERLALIKDRVEMLKKQKIEQGNNQKALSLSEVYAEPEIQFESFSLSLSIPDEILSIEQRVCRLQEKIVGYQIHRQRTEKKRTVVERVKALQKKLESLLKANKSSDTATNSINKYSENLDEREEYMKQIYLYDVYTKTQGLTDELSVLEIYLQNLSKVQRVVNSVLPATTLISKHNQILARSQSARTRVQKLFSQMKEQYQKLIEQIDAIEI